MIFQSAIRDSDDSLHALVVDVFFKMPATDAKECSRGDINRWLNHLSSCPDDIKCAHVPPSINWQEHVQAPCIHPTEGAFFEYFCCCVSFFLLERFFNEVPAFDELRFREHVGHSVLHSKFCDLAFATFIFKAGKWKLLPLKSDEWTYLKVERPEGMRNTFVYGPTVDDQRIAGRRLVEEKALAANYPADIDLGKVSYESYGDVPPELLAQMIQGGGGCPQQ